ncbi:MAG: PAS domain-containing protein [Methanomicrobiales archaeon]|nr:PAS domain-containing protein [Methanomicrobiales archaeon]
MTMPLTEVFSMPAGGDPLNLLHRGLEEFILYPEPAPGRPSFYDLCFHRIPEDLCEEILRTLNIGKAYITFLVWSDRLFGTVGIFLPPDAVLEDRQAIESFLRQASIAIARRQTEDRLRRSEQRFTEVLDASPVPAALLDHGGRHLYLNRAFTERFGYTLADTPTENEWFERAFPDAGYRQSVIADWKTDLEQSGSEEIASRIYRVQCKNGAEKTVRFCPVALTDGNRYITCEEIGVG